MPLPPELRWAPVIPSLPSVECLWIGIKPVARVDQRVTDGWVSMVNYHLPYERRRSIIVSSEDQARKWAERWAVANLKRLLRECNQPH